MVPTELIRDAVRSKGPVVVLTGAGVSAASGIPTFRGPEGYWKVGSKNYHPQEMATRAAFRAMPDEVWSWYLYRRSVCRRAEPNAAHRALVELEGALGDRFLLVTQNVDGLHLRAGSSPARTYQIHGNIDFYRCFAECTDDLFEMPAIDLDWPKERKLAGERELLVCPHCGERGRPHVLWFDETYDEVRFRFESSIRAAHTASMLVVVGTAGQTNLPLHMGSIAARRGIPMIDINPDENPFGELASASKRGYAWVGAADELVPELARAIEKELSASG
jgi:NAD-dependent deacetylase